MEALSTARRNAAVLSLALGGFAVGLTEFVAMGLLPEMAQGLLPAEYARSTSDAVAETGWTITVYSCTALIGAFLGIGGVVASTADVFRIVSARKRGRCPECNYSLRGNVTGVCPECGNAVVADSENTTDDGNSEGAAE